MRISLKPLHPNPTVLFDLAFPNITNDLPIPQAWADQLHSLNIDGLQPPALLHCLDKASILPCLLEIVTFDAQQRTIRCRFIDGSTMEWPYEDVRCTRLLEAVVKDVGDSSSPEPEDGEEMHTTSPGERQHERRQTTTSLNSTTPSVKVSRLKKHRTLLLSFVTSFSSSGFTLSKLFSKTPPTSPTLSETPHTPRPSPPATPVEPESRPDTPLRPMLGTPQALRKRARSTLVEAFRLFVQTKLHDQLPSDGYYSWILQSTIEQATKRLNELEQGGIGPARSRTESSATQDCIPSRTLPGLDSDSDETDTDGSFIQTPSTGHFPVSPFDVPSSVSRTPSPERPMSNQQQEYKALVSLRVRLGHLLFSARTREVHIQNNKRQQEMVLEVRSRRRAWLNKSLVKSGPHDIRLATPFQTSPLHLLPWTSEDYDYIRPLSTGSSVFSDDYDWGEIEVVEDHDINERYSMGSKRVRSNASVKLFPVTEEDQEEMDNEDEEYDFFMNGTSEGDVSILAEFDALDIATPRMKPRTRTRTTSMHEDQPHIKAPTQLDGLSPLSKTPFIRRPVVFRKEPQMSRLEQPEVYVEDDQSIPGFENFPTVDPSLSTVFSI